MAKRSKKDEIDPRRSIREQFYPKGRNRGLLIRVQVDFFKTGEVARYALALVDINGVPITAGSSVMTMLMTTITDTAWEK